MKFSDIDYLDICRILKRYSFDEKMRISNHYSRQVININGDIEVDRMLDKIHPWELETFILMSIRATPEYNHGDFQGKNLNKFLKIINAIRAYEHPKLSSKHDSIHFGEHFMVATGLIQFDIQESKHYKMYRYNYIFNFVNDNVNMTQEFLNKFGTEYREFLDFGSYMIFLFGSHLRFNGDVVNYLANVMFPNAFHELSISLESYKEELNRITPNVEDYITCLRPSYKYPFIMANDKIYFPLPHLIGRATTSSLLYRLTEANNSLRDKLGKDVLESYLIKILEEALIYDEIYPEKEFEMEHHNRAKTLDAMVRIDEEYLMLDCKAAVPHIGLRIFDEKIYQNEIKGLTKNVIQVYKHLRKFLPNYKSYNPYDGKPQIEKEHLWGMTVVLEDSYVKRELVYKAAANELGIEIDSEEYIWMITHVKVTNLYDVERFCFTGRSLVDGLKAQIEHGYPYNHALSQNSSVQYDIINSNYVAFLKEQKQKFKTITNKIEGFGIKFF